MKSYIDIEQSKKFAEILPIESADMYFQPHSNGKDWYDIPYFGEADKKFNQLPCWSLAAIIELLPYDIKGHNLAIYKSYCPNEKTFAYELSYEGDFYDYELSILASTSSIELIDACYEMIIKLNELKML